MSWERWCNNCRTYFKKEEDLSKSVPVPKKNLSHPPTDIESLMKSIQYTNSERLQSSLPISGTSSTHQATDIETLTNSIQSTSPHPLPSISITDREQTQKVQDIDPKDMTESQLLDPNFSNFTPSQRKALILSGGICLEMFSMDDPKIIEASKNPYPKISREEILETIFLPLDELKIWLDERYPISSSKSKK